MRILLVSANRLRDPYPVHPIGLDHVAGVLAPAHDVRILDLCPLEEEAIPAVVAGAVREHAPGAVGVSIRNVDVLDAADLGGPLEDARRAVELVRAATDAPIVLGGAGFTIFPAEHLDALGADWGVVGEGERARPLFDALAAGASPRGLPGVVARGEPAVAPPPLGAWGPGARSARRPPARGPALDFYLARGGMLGLQTQRGCALRCVYCTYPSIEGRAIRPFDAEALLAEARALRDAGARYLVLTDSVFNGDPDHALAVAEAFRRGDLGIPWGGFFTPARMPDGFYEALRAGGCTHAEFGTESMCDPILARLRKPFRRADVLRTHAAARAAGLHVAHFMLLGGPGETEATLEETFDGCEALEGGVLFFFCGMRIYPRTELFELAVAAGQIRREDPLLAPVLWDAPGLPRAELLARVERRAAGRRSWRTGSGEGEAALLARMHARGRVGPLWEMLA